MVRNTIQNILNWLLLHETKKNIENYLDFNIERLMGRGKKKMVALNNVKNKLLHMVTAMVKNGQKYDPKHLKLVTVA